MPEGGDDDEPPSAPALFQKIMGVANSDTMHPLVKAARVRELANSTKRESEGGGCCCCRGLKALIRATGIKFKLCIDFPRKRVSTLACCTWCLFVVAAVVFVVLARKLADSSTNTIYVTCVVSLAVLLAFLCCCCFGGHCCWTMGAKRCAL